MSADPTFAVDGRVAIVTGATSGLGERFARVLAARGATVVAAGRREERLEALAAEVDGIVPCRCDVSDDADLARLLAFTVERCGVPRILVNNAGISNGDGHGVETPAMFRRVLDVNLNALFVLSQLTGEAMLAGEGGAIVNIASMFGLVASVPGNRAAYAASKGGVVQLTRQLGAQWARGGVRVNAMAPGFFPSEMNTDRFADERAEKWMRRNTPAGRIGEPHELDGVLLLLASDASSFMTGQTIAVDGGWTAR